MSEVLKPNEARARNALLLIKLMLLANAVSFLVELYFYILVKDNLRSNEWNEKSQRLLYTEYIKAACDAALFILIIVSMLTFILWFRRAYYNLGKITGNLSFPDSWAVLCWIIPIINLFRPYRLTKEMFTKCSDYLSEKVPGRKGEKFAFLLRAWWILWIISAIIGQIVFRTSLNAETYDKLVVVSEFIMIDSLINIILALITIAFMKKYFKMEEELKMVMLQESINSASGEMSLDPGPQDAAPGTV